MLKRPAASVSPGVALPPAKRPAAAVVSDRVELVSLVTAQEIERRCGQRYRAEVSDLRSAGSGLGLAFETVACQVSSGLWTD